MKKKKIKLNELKLHSFVTQASGAKGGFVLIDTNLYCSVDMTLCGGDSYDQGCFCA